MNDTDLKRWLELDAKTTGWPNLDGRTWEEGVEYGKLGH